MPKYSRLSGIYACAIAFDLVLREFLLQSESSRCRAPKRIRAVGLVSAERLEFEIIEVRRRPRAAEVLNAETDHRAGEALAIIV